MIFDSTPWKAALLDTAVWLKTLRVTTDTDEAQLVLLEKQLFFAAYSIRKLHEAKKLTDLVAEQKVKVVCHPNRKSVTFLNRDRWEENYDLYAEPTEELSLIRICHQFVHSFVFAPVFDDSGGLDCVLVASDHQKDKGLFRVTCAQLVEAFEQVGSDEVAQLHYVRDGGGKETVALS